MNAYNPACYDTLNLIDNLCLPKYSNVWNLLAPLDLTRISTKMKFARLRDVILDN